MNKLKILVSFALALTMLAPISSYALFDDVNDVCVENSSPVIDAVIEKSDGWGDEVVLNNDTLAVISHNKQNPIDMSAKAYMAYDDTYFYFSADITEFGENMTIENLLCPSDITTVSDDSDFGFDGDVFGITMDIMSLLVANPSNYEENAPYYCVGFDNEGNGAVYHSNGSENAIITADKAQVAVAFTETGWRFEAAVAWDVIVADMCAKLGVKEFTYEQWEDLLYGNLDSKANFVYKSNRLDIEAEEVITYAEYASVAETALDGTPGYMLFGSAIKTFGVIFYLNHEHDTVASVEKEEDFATFTKDGVKTAYCKVCGRAVGTEVLPMIPFTDVKAGMWYEDALLRCYNYEYFKGMSETKFGPNVTMTRAMFVQVLANYFGEDTSAYKCDSFSDVKPNHWYYGAVAWAYEKGITSGTSETKFSPNKALTRQEAAALFANTLKAMDMYKAPSANEFDVKYTDSSKVDSWAKEAMLWAVENGVISGMSETTLGPRGSATRMQVAKMLCNLDDYLISVAE